MRPRPRRRFAAFNTQAEKQAKHASTLKMPNLAGPQLAATAVSEDDPCFPAALHTTRSRQAVQHAPRGRLAATSPARRRSISRFSTRRYTWFRESGEGTRLTKAQIVESVDASLRRLPSSTRDRKEQSTDARTSRTSAP